jgi:plasmid maintenance system antidote protein VapI
MDEIKLAVSDSIYESSKLKEMVSNEARISIESAYDFDTFFENLQKLSLENQLLKDNVISNQKYLNDLNGVVFKLLEEFRNLTSLVQNIKPDTIETISKVEQVLEINKEAFVNLDNHLNNSNETDNVEEVISTEDEDTEGSNNNTEEELTLDAEQLERNRKAQEEEDEVDRQLALENDNSSTEGTE